MKRVFAFLKPRTSEFNKDLVKVATKLSALKDQVEPLRSKTNQVEAFVELIQILYKFQEGRMLDKAILALRKRNDESLSLILRELRGFNKYIKALDKRHNLSEPGEAICAYCISFYCGGAKEADLVPISYILENEAVLKKQFREHAVNGIKPCSEWYLANDILARVMIADVIEWLESLMSEINENFTQEEF